VFSRRASRGCRSPIRWFRFLAAASAQASPGQEDRRASLARTSEAIGSREPEDVPSYSFGPSPCIRLLWPLLTSRSAFPRRPFSREAGYPQARTPSFRANHRIYAALALTTRALRSLARSPYQASPHIRFLSIGSRFRSTLPLHARLPSRSCASLRSLWSAHGSTCTSKITPILGAQAKIEPIDSAPSCPAV
jgi:hypothetical protein